MALPSSCRGPRPAAEGGGGGGGGGGGEYCTGTGGGVHGCRIRGAGGEYAGKRREDGSGSAPTSAVCAGKEAREGGVTTTTTSSSSSSGAARSRGELDGGGDRESVPGAALMEAGALKLDMIAAARENEAAELVLEQLDEQWFCDNVVRWPSSRPGSPPGVIDKNFISPFRHASERLPGPPPLQLQAAAGAASTRPRAWSGERVFNHPRSRLELRRLSDGDHHLRRLAERDQIPRRRLLDQGDDTHHRLAENLNASNFASLPHTPTNTETTDHLRHQPSSGDLQVDDDVPVFPLPSSGRLMGVTEDEEMENDLFAKMIANRPDKLTTINPGRQPRGPLQESNSSEPAKQATKRTQIKQRRRLKGTKSLTDLEYEELRGLKDLGFEASKDDLTPHVVRMFPGLLRQGIPPYNANSPQGRYPAVQHVLWQRRPDSPLLNTNFLDPNVDMKGQLKSWASAMASIVSTEC